MPYDACNDGMMAYTPDSSSMEAVLVVKYTSGQVSSVPGNHVTREISDRETFRHLFNSLSVHTSLRTLYTPPHTPLPRL
jgi:hypothetical protein